MPGEGFHSKTTVFDCEKAIYTLDVAATVSGKQDAITHQCPYNSCWALNAFRVLNLYTVDRRQSNHSDGR
jgi:hypothetical protein